MNIFTKGYRGVNKQGLEYDIIDDRLAKKTLIRFILDGAEVVTTRNYLRKGLPMHPTYGKPKIGDLYQDNKGNVVELVSKEGASAWRVRWKKDGAEAVRNFVSIKSGCITHPVDGKIKTGQVWKTNSGLYIRVIEFYSAVSVVVQFNDGTKTKTTAAAIRSGTVGHPTSGLCVGQEFQTNSGWRGTIKEYKSCYEIKVQWQDGSYSWHDACDIKNGSIKPPCQPSVAGVGYYGVGKFSNGLKKFGDTPPPEIYSYWTRMLNRCYNPIEVLKKRGQSYIYTEVHKDWFCFQNFAEWALEQPNWGMGHELDKDLLGDGSEYSADSCTFLPTSINSFLAETRTRPIHNLPLGVQYLKPGTTNAKTGYVARCCTEKGREYLGYFDDPMDAYYAYKSAKEAYAHRLATTHRGVLSDKAYDALSNYELRTIYVQNISSCVSATTH